MSLWRNHLLPTTTAATRGSYDMMAHWITFSSSHFLWLNIGRPDCETLSPTNYVYQPQQCGWYFCVCVCHPAKCGCRSTNCSGNYHKGGFEDFEWCLCLSGCLRMDFVNTMAWPCKTQWQSFRGGCGLTQWVVSFLSHNLLSTSNMMYCLLYKIQYLPYEA